MSRKGFATMCLSVILTLVMCMESVMAAAIGEEISEVECPAEEVVGEEIREVECPAEEVVGEEISEGEEVSAEGLSVAGNFDYTVNGINLKAVDGEATTSLNGGSTIPLTGRLVTSDGAIDSATNTVYLLYGNGKLYIYNFSQGTTGKPVSTGLIVEEIIASNGSLTSIKTASGSKPPYTAAEVASIVSAGGTGDDIVPDNPEEIITSDITVKFELDRVVFTKNGRETTIQTGELGYLDSYQIANDSAFIRFTNGSVYAWNDSLSQDLIWVTNNSNGLYENQFDVGGNSVSYPSVDELKILMGDETQIRSTRIKNNEGFYDIAYINKFGQAERLTTFTSETTMMVETKKKYKNVKKDYQAYYDKKKNLIYVQKGGKKIWRVTVSDSGKITKKKIKLGKKQKFDYLEVDSRTNFVIAIVTKKGKRIDPSTGKEIESKVSQNGIYGGYYNGYYGTIKSTD